MSKIEWTDATWNPVVGCSKVSEGCRNCYAMRMAARQAAIADAKGDASAQQRAYQRVVKRRPGSVNDARTGVPLPQWNNRVVCVEETLEIPLRWKKPRMVFVNSMGDLFHPDVPIAFIAKCFAVMGLASWHTYQVLTKRPERMAAVMRSEEFRELLEEAESDLESFAYEVAKYYGYFDPCARVSDDWAARGPVRVPLPNVWLGTSIEDQPTADERIPHLLRCPASVRFLSCEPLLGEVEVDWAFDPVGYVSCGGYQPCSCEGCQAVNNWPCDEFGHISPDWVIVGCESNGGRVGRVEGFEDHARSIVRQCREAGTACFVKQIPIGGRVSHDPAEWPEELRVRQWPEAATRP